jgi:hypothetical protein
MQASGIQSTPEGQISEKKGGYTMTHPSIGNSELYTGRNPLIAVCHAGSRLFSIYCEDAYLGEIQPEGWTMTRNDVYPGDGIKISVKFVGLPEGYDPVEVANDVLLAIKEQFL